jgi:hypothetical protein
LIKWYGIPSDVYTLQAADGPVELAGEVLDLITDLLAEETTDAKE